MSSKTIKKFRYVYNILQADFYIQNGIKPCGCGVGQYGDVFIKFKDSKELQEVFSSWMARVK